MDEEGDYDEQEEDESGNEGISSGSQQDKSGLHSSRNKQGTHSNPSEKSDRKNCS